MVVINDIIPNIWRYKRAINWVSRVSDYHFISISRHSNCNAITGYLLYGDNMAHLFG